MLLQKKFPNLCYKKDIIKLDFRKSKRSKQKKEKASYENFKESTTNFKKEY